MFFVSAILSRNWRAAMFAKIQHNRQCRSMIAYYCDVVDFHVSIIISSAIISAASQLLTRRFDPPTPTTMYTARYCANQQTLLLYLLLAELDKSTDNELTRMLRTANGCARQIVGISTVYRPYNYCRMLRVLNRIFQSVLIEQCNNGTRYHVVQ